MSTNVYQLLNPSEPQLLPPHLSNRNISVYLARLSLSGWFSPPSHRGLSPGLILSFSFLLSLLPQHHSVITGGGQHFLENTPPVFPYSFSHSYCPFRLVRPDSLLQVLFPSLATTVIFLNHNSYWGISLLENGQILCLFSYWLSKTFVTLYNELILPTWLCARE